MAINLFQTEQKISFDERVNHLVHPIRMIISGPSASGKSRFMLKLIKYRENIFTTKFTRILYCVPNKNSEIHEGLFNEIKAEFPSAEIIFGLPKPNDIMGDNLPKLVLLDDLMNLIFNDKFMEETFIQNSHHCSCSIIFTSQNFFNSGKSKTIIRQCTYKVFFNDPSDKILLRLISCQLTPQNPNFLIKAFDILDELFPEDNFKYILIDADSQSPMKQLRVRTNIFPNEEGLIRPLCFFTINR